MGESIFAALFILSLFGQVLAVVAGFAALAMPTRKTVQSIAPRAPVHA